MLAISILAPEELPFMQVIDSLYSAGIELIHNSI